MDKQLNEAAIEAIISKTCGKYRTGDSYTFEDVWNCIAAALASDAAGAPVGEVVGFRETAFASIPIIAWETKPEIGTKLYAAPVAPAAGAPTVPLPDAVYAKLSEPAKCRTSRENVVDVLHAMISAELRAVSGPTVAANADENTVRIDRRDLFDFVRGEIRSALSDGSCEGADNGEPKAAADCWSEAHSRTEILFDKLALAAPTPTERMSDAARDVLAERARQVSEEGFTPTRDDSYVEGQLAQAGAAYAIAVADHTNHIINSGAAFYTRSPDIWPWSEKWWKPTNPRRALVKAAALILAEIERIDRAARKAEIERDGGKV